MEIEINIEKKHLYFLVSLFGFLLMGLVIAVPEWESGKPHHELLFTNEITGKSDGTVTIEGGLDVTGELTAEKDLEVTGDLNIDGRIIDFGAGNVWSATSMSSWADFPAHIPELGSLYNFTNKCDNGKIMVGLEVKTETGWDVVDNIYFKPHCASIEDILD